MRINDGSICSDCKHFEHECDVPIGEDDFQCIELCNHPNVDIAIKYHEISDEIKECEGFE